MAFNRQKLAHAMGHPKRHLPREGAVIAALDVGAAKAVCFIARVIPAANGMVDCEIVGAGHYGFPASDKTSHLGFAQRESAIRSAIDAAETMAGERIREIHVAVPGRALTCRRVAVELELAGSSVTVDDLADSLTEGSRPIVPDLSTTLHILPTGYQLDGEQMGTDPRGYRGQQLRTHMVGISVDDAKLENIASLVESAGIKVASFIAAPVAAATSTVVEDEKDLGVLTIDIGADSLSYCLHQDGRLTGCGGVIPGGRHISRDIAQIFSTPIEHAERQKILNGSVLLTTGDDHRFVDMPGLVPSRATPAEGHQRIPRSELTNVIIARMEDLYETLSRRIHQDQCPLKLTRRLVLTGGGSQLDGICQHAEQIFGMKSRLGRPALPSGVPEALTGPAFAVVGGVIVHLLHSYDRQIPYAELEGIVGAKSDHDVPRLTGTLGQVGSWLRKRF